MMKKYNDLGHMKPAIIFVAEDKVYVILQIIQPLEGEILRLKSIVC